ncbi:iron chaperone [Gracilibacillus halophilus]|uniref:iron chaperone n=1 Tax=Gracilibacillus halophilus TaxID=470864 RepID=UPI00058B3A13|nr:iron chaperone [Gracilibacillus halophilus]
MEPFTDFIHAIEQPEQRERTEKVLTWVRETFPQLEAAMKWNQPMFMNHGTFIIAFSIAKPHLAIAPERKAMFHFEEEIQAAGYSASKQLIRIKWTQSVDYALLKRIIEYNIEDKKDVTTFWRK